jgi:hypothetical protein
MSQVSNPPTESETASWLFDKGIPYRAWIAGTVEPIEWDENDCVTRVCIYVEEEETEYEVVENSRGQELLQMVGARVMARGVIDHIHKDVFEIRVAEYNRSD